ncbi:MAG: HAD hydrolase-like protein [Candidatus Helarchaeota archaeon]|nr:HAD hydrolase-like protein [Candidatus Helarchaeota archaeon]
MIKTLIFDLDGTLVNLNLNTEKLVLELQALLGTKLESGPLLESVISYTEENSKLRKKAWAIIDRVEKESIANLQIFPETISVLNEIKGKTYGLALVTLQGQKATALVLRKLALTHFFNPIITRENSHLRSHQLELVLNSLNISRDEVLFVGDRLNDLQEARKVEINCILIRRKFNPLDGTIVIQSLSELLQYV